MGGSTRARGATGEEELDEEGSDGVGGTGKKGLGEGSSTGALCTRFTLVHRTESNYAKKINGWMNNVDLILYQGKR